MLKIVLKDDEETSCVMIDPENVFELGNFIENHYRRNADGKIEFSFEGFDK